MPIRAKSQDLLELWKTRIYSWEASKQSVSAWCKENKIHTRLFYYWRNKIQGSLKKKPNFVELKNPKLHSKLELSVNGIRLIFPESFDELLISKLLKFLSSLTC